MTIEERIKALEIEILALERLLNEREKGNTKALNLQAEEYHRRLDALNHENERILNIQNSCVANNVYAVQHKVVTDDIKELQAFKDNQQGRQVIVPVVISFVMGLITVGIAYLLRK